MPLYTPDIQLTLCTLQLHAPEWKPLPSTERTRELSNNCLLKKKEKYIFNGKHHSLGGHFMCIYLPIKLRKKKPEKKNPPLLWEPLGPSIFSTTTFGNTRINSNSLNLIVWACVNLSKPSGDAYRSMPSKPSSPWSADVARGASACASQSCEAEKDEDRFPYAVYASHETSGMKFWPFS